MTLTFGERHYIKTFIITIIIVFGVMALTMFVNYNLVFLIFLMFISFFIRAKPLKKPIFEKCLHHTRNRITRACERCGIKVIWEGDEYKYDD